MLEDLIIAVPGGAESVDVLAARLDELGLVGWVIDGARLGHDGWVLARVAADDEGALATGAEEWTLLEIDDLRAALATTWPQVQVDDVVIGDHDVVGPLCQSPAARLHEIAFATAKGMGLAMEASLEKLTLAEVRRGPKTLFARVQPIDGPEHRLVDVFTTAKGGSVIVWRRDPHVVLQVLRGSQESELHVWEPAWTPIGPSDHDDVRDELRPPRAEAVDIARALDLPEDSVGALDALLRRESPPLNQLCDLLGLPDEAARVISGECAVEELPGAIVHEPTSFVAAMRAALRPSDDDPAWMQRLDEGAREVRPWYVVSSLTSVALGVALIAARRTGGSRTWRAVGLALVLGSVIDLPVRLWLKRRRRETVDAPPIG